MRVGDRVTTQERGDGTVVGFYRDGFSLSRRLSFTGVIVEHDSGGRSVYRGDLLKILPAPTAAAVHPSLGTAAAPPLPASVTQKANEA